MPNVIGWINFLFVYFGNQNFLSIELLGSRIQAFLLILVESYFVHCIMYIVHISMYWLCSSVGVKKTEILKLLEIVLP